MTKSKGKRALTPLIEAVNRKRLYHVGNLSIFMIGLGFAVRANQTLPGRK